MRAGTNRICNLLTFSYPTDDSSGGALPSGTTLYENLSIRIEPMKPSQVLLEQGLQVPRLYNANVFAGNIEAKENDQIVFTAPVNDWYYNKKFRVIGVMRDSSHPFLDRNQIRLVVRRWEESHANDLQ